MARGLRNNNPGNIRLSRVEYLGEKLSSDTAFKQFNSIDWGYRAMFVVLDSYYRRGLTNIEAMLERYAPPIENETDNYINFVVKHSGLDSKIDLDINNKRQMMALVSAMSYMENGVPACEQDVERGWELFQEFKP